MWRTNINKLETTTTGSCGYYPQLPVVALHLIKQPKKTNVSFVHNLQNPP